LRRTGKEAEKEKERGREREIKVKERETEREKGKKSRGLQVETRRCVSRWQRCSRRERECVCVCMFVCAERSSRRKSAARQMKEKERK